MSTPIVSVLLPVYNALHDLPRAMHSLQNQTFRDFEVIAIDDGSTDGSADLLDQYAGLDPRVRVFHQPNAGTLGAVLNRAAELAQGKYLARQDSDDASAPTRLEDQVNYFERKPEIGVCGTWAWFIDEELGPLFSYELPDEHARIVRYLEKGRNPLVHGSVMMRADLLDKTGGYRGSLSEDFDLWLRMAEITRLGMSTRLGYYYWRSSSGITSGAHSRQRELARMYLELHAQRSRFGRETSDWAIEYQKIEPAHSPETLGSQRQSSAHYARGLHLLRLGQWKRARLEMQTAGRGHGQFATKARRNLSFFRLAPVLRILYGLMEFREPYHYSRVLASGTPLPEFLLSPWSNP